MRAGLRLLLDGLRGQRRPLLWLLVWSVVEAVPALLTGKFLALALDRGFLAGEPAVGFGWLGGLVAAAGVAAVATRLVYPQLAAVVEPLRDTLVHVVVDASLRVPLHEANPAAVARVTGQVETTRRLVSALLRTARQVTLAIVATVVGTTVLAPALTLVVAPPLVLALTLFGLLLPRLVDRQRAVVLADEAVAREATGVLHGLRDVLACQAKRRATRTVETAINQQAAAGKALARVSSLRILVVALGVQLPLVAVIASGPLFVREGWVTTGALVAAAGYLTVTLAPAMQALVQVAGAWGLQLAVVLARLAETAQAGSATETATLPVGTSRAPLTRTVAAHDLTFAYGPHSTPVLNGLDLRVRGEEHLAIVGPSGVGKSTLADLLAGLLIPAHGEVRVGDRDLRALSPEQLHRLVTLIPQESYVFGGTVRENLAYLEPEVQDWQLRRVVEELGVPTLIDRLGGLDATLQPTTLGSGERQLVALVRAYASPAEVIVLDEATCHLDPATEESVERAFSRRYGTLVVIAHRISSALRADRILVLDGDSATVGTHADLLARSALYKELVGYWTTPDADPTDHTAAPVAAAP
ncbi:MAG: ATP-binding cassette domain-containing protein [Streptosporangiales bacterium]|nr:ATP-binding cassette domain-containing protein [Streptosporangiales bacterium]